MRRQRVRRRRVRGRVAAGQNQSARMGWHGNVAPRFLSSVVSPVASEGRERPELLASTSRLPAWNPGGAAGGASLRRSESRFCWAMPREGLLAAAAPRRLPPGRASARSTAERQLFPPSLPPLLRSSEPDPENRGLSAFSLSSEPDSRRRLPLPTPVTDSFSALQVMGVPGVLALFSSQRKNPVLVSYGALCADGAGLGAVGGGRAAASATCRARFLEWPSWERPHLYEGGRDGSVFSNA